MLVQVHNLTDDTIVSLDQETRQSYIISPGATAKLKCTSQSICFLYTSPGEKVPSTAFSISLRLRHLWKTNTWRLRLPSSPWNIYTSCRQIFVLPKRDLGHFLGEMPDEASLSDLCLPGTHETMAFHGWPISQCQEASTPLLSQLSNGIRVLDIRLSIADDELMTYHGIFPQNTPLPSIITDLHTFLTTHPRETLVVSIKQEDVGASVFNRLLARDIERSEGGWGMWFMEGRIPKLGEVRGRCVMFSRFGGTPQGWPLERGLGIHPISWPDSVKGFEWWCGETLVRTQDWYSIPSFLEIPEKTALAIGVLLPPPQGPPPFPVLNVSFTSAASVPFALPPVVAKGAGWPNSWLHLGFEGVNARVGRRLLEILKDEGKSEEKAQQQKARGWVFMDFYDDPKDLCVPLLVECNYRWRQS